uniref:Sepiapterin reductase n=1 Tax=Strongyloides stercoralis TaxID=6248 RepID=A0A0K0ELF5_STRER
MNNCIYKGRSAIVITGATGVIGKALVNEFASNILENSTLLLSSRDKFRLKCLKNNILKIRPDITIETVVWNLEEPDYNLFFSDIKKAFSSPSLYNNDKLNHYDTSYSTAIIIHNATDIGDIDKTVYEHGKNPKRIQKILNINTVSLITLTSAFLQYFNYFKTKKFIVNMLSPCSKYPLPYFGHISLKCASKMILDILSEEESGKLKVLHYNPVAIDTENWRKIKNFIKNESIREVYDILYKTQKFNNPYDISRHLFSIINSNNFLNGCTVSFGININNNNDEDNFCMINLFEQLKVDTSKKNEDKKIVKMNLIETLDLSKLEKNINNNKSNELNSNSKIDSACILDKKSDFNKEYHNNYDEESLKLLKSRDNKKLDHEKEEYFQHTKDIKLTDGKKTENIVKDSIKNDIVYDDNLTENSKISHSSFKKEELNNEIEEFNINKPQTLYQKYKEIYLNEKLHSQPRIVIPNSSSFKIIKSLYDRSRNQTSDDFHIYHNEVSRKFTKTPRNNFKKNRCKSTNNKKNKNEAFTYIKTKINPIKILSDKNCCDKEETTLYKNYENNLDINTLKQTSMDKVLIDKNKDITFKVEGKKEKKIYIINGVKYHVEGSFKFSN